MIAKLTSKNQLTLPKAIVLQVPDVDYFEISMDGSRIVLTPVRVQASEMVRSKLASLGITENDIDDAVAWARQRQAQ